jgi:hypothetical protein
VCLWRVFTLTRMIDAVTATGLGVGVLVAVSALAVVGSLGHTHSTALLSAGAFNHQRLQSLAYTFEPEENPLADFDKDFKARPYGESAKAEKNPFDEFQGYGFSTVTHTKGESPYPASTEADTHNVYEDMPEDKYPFDERKDGLKEVMHDWKHWDWKKAPSAAIDEVNVWGNNGLPGTETSDDSGADTSWNLGDKMTFAWKHWKKTGHAEDAPTKALGEINVWDNPAPYERWTKTPGSVVDDPNDEKAGTEKNILMNYKFPNY